MQGSTRGKLVILVILGMAVAAASFSTWYNYQGSYRALDFWGTRLGVLIDQSPQIRAIALAESADTGPDDAASSVLATGERLALAGQTYRVLATHDSSQAHGIKNIRRALVLNPAYDWLGPPSAEPPHWQYALEFKKGTETALVLFDFDTRQITAAGHGKIARLNQAANDDILTFFGEQFEAAR